jgi:transposase
MSGIRKKHSKELKFKVAVEALTGNKTTAEICREFGVHDTQIQKWKKLLREQGSSLFTEVHLRNSQQSELEARIKQLNEIIGELSVENKFFKKNFNQ